MIKFDHVLFLHRPLMFLLQFIPRYSVYFLFLWISLFLKNASWLFEILKGSWRLSLGFPCGSAGKESACSVGDLDLIPGLGRSPGEGKSYPLQYFGLENSMDCIGHGVTKSWTRLSDFQFVLMYFVSPNVLCNFLVQVDF